VPIKEQIMPKNIFKLVVLLWISPVVSQTNPILSECEALKQDYAALTQLEPNLAAITHLERKVIKLENMQDMMHYFLGFLVGKQREPFLACQTTLAQEFQKLLSFLEQNQWSKTLKELHNDAALNYATAIEQLLDKKMPLASQQALISTQSTYKALLEKKKSVIDLPATCQLKTQHQEVQTQLKSTALHVYLIQQENEACRKFAWLSMHQKHTPEINKLKAHAYTLYKQQAVLHGYEDPLAFQIKNFYLSKKEWIQYFLDQHPSQNNIKPWNLLNFLVQKRKEDQGALSIESIDSTALLLQTMTAIGLTVQSIHPGELRIWNDQRLFGELILVDSETIMSKHPKKTVVGRQYGVSYLFAPKTIETMKQKKQLILALGNGLRNISQPSRYYLLTEHLTPEDISQVGIYWLMNTFAPPTDLWAEVEGALAYIKWLKSKDSFNFFGDATASKTQLDFHQLLDDGGYYKTLWQKNLAQYISNQLCLSHKEMFELFFEKDLYQTLETLRANQPMARFIDQVLQTKRACS
jgi:hypothetical protein